MCVITEPATRVKCPLAREIANSFRVEASALLAQTGAGVEAAAAARALAVAAKIIDRHNARPSNGVHEVD